MKPHLSIQQLLKHLMGSILLGMMPVACTQTNTTNPRATTAATTELINVKNLWSATYGGTTALPAVDTTSVPGSIKIVTAANQHVQAWQTNVTPLIAGTTYRFSITTVSGDADTATLFIRNASGGVVNFPTGVDYQKISGTQVVDFIAPAGVAQFYLQIDGPWATTASVSIFNLSLTTTTTTPPPSNELIDVKKLWSATYGGTTALPAVDTASVPGSIKIVTVSTQHISAWQTNVTPLTAGTTYNFSITTVSGDAASAKLFLRNASGGVVNFLVTPAQDWLQVSGTQTTTFVAPSGVAQFYLQIDSPWVSTATSTVFNLSLKPTTTTPPPPPPTSTWKNLEIGGGGMVTGIAIHPKVKDLVYIRTDVGGMYRWNETTAAWTPLFDGFDLARKEYFQVESLALDAQNQQVVYAAAGQTNYSGNKGVILKSTDQGATWNIINNQFYMAGNGQFRSGGERLAVDPNNSQVVYFGSRKDGLWRTSNGGTAWTQVAAIPIGTAEFADDETQGVGWVAFDPTSGTAGTSSKHLWAGVARIGVFESRDAGATWTNVKATPNFYMGDASVTAAGNLYTSFLKRQIPSSKNGFWPDDSMPSNNTPETLFKCVTASAGAACTWTNISPKVGTNFDGVSAVAVNGVDQVIVTPWYWNRIYRSLYTSNNGGVTWKEQALNAKDTTGKSLIYGQEKWLSDPAYATAPANTNLQNDADVFQTFSQAVAIDPFRQNRAWALGGFGVWRTDNLSPGVANANWTTYSKGISETVDISTKSLSNGKIVTGIADLSGFVYASATDIPSTSTRVKNGFPIFATTGLDVVSNDPNYIACVGKSATYGTAFAGTSIDGGLTWKSFPTIPLGSDGKPVEMGRIAFGRNDKTNIVWVNSGWDSVGKSTTGVYATLDGGTTWAVGKVNGVPFNPFNSYAGLFSRGETLVADPVNAKTFYAFGDNNSYLPKVFRSTDGGINWTLQSQFPTSWQQKSQLRAMPGRVGDLWVSRMGDGLSRSKDGGTTFASVGGFTMALGVSFGKSAPTRTNPTVFVAGIRNGQEGIWRSDDEGLTWVSISDASKNVLTSMFANIEGDINIYGRVYIATDGRGTFYGPN